MQVGVRWSVLLVKKLQQRPLRWGLCLVAKQKCSQVAALRALCWQVVEKVPPVLHLVPPGHLTPLLQIQQIQQSWPLHAEK
mmetsp:Transcript_39648/g.99647  ORF Transcript_39648/g.99647 Transcript_39648/m.99647 type:complete len:81 (-) Transcript_39648:323-565(-)